MTTTADISGATRTVFVVADPILQVKTPSAQNAVWTQRGADVVTLPAHVASDELLARVAVPDGVEELAEQEYRAYLLARALHLMQAELPAHEWRACQAYMLQGQPAAEAARECGMSVNQLYLAKSRILRRLRQELEGLLD